MCIRGKSFYLPILFLEIVQRIGNVNAKEKKYSIGRRQIIDGFAGKPRDTGTIIEITYYYIYTQRTIIQPFCLHVALSLITLYVTLAADNY